MRNRSTFAQASRFLAAVAILTAGRNSTAGSQPSPLSVQNARASEWARAGAATRLQRATCQKVLTDFTDGQGHSLQESLEARGLGATDYPWTLTFVDGSTTRSCRMGPWVLLGTTPGIASVGVCPMDGHPFTSRFAQAQLRNPSFAEAIVIHEMLHALGLGENPPTSEEIARQVQARFGP